MQLLVALTVGTQGAIWLPFHVFDEHSWFGIFLCGRFGGVRGAGAGLGRCSTSSFKS